MAVVDRQLQFRGSALRVMSGETTASDVYDVLTDGNPIGDPREEIYQAFPDWWRGVAHPSIVGLRVRSWDANNWESPIRWRVTVNYSTPGPGVIEDNNPFLQPPEFEGDGEQEMQNVETDVAGNAIETTAGEPFEPGAVEIPMPTTVFRVTRNYPVTPTTIPFLTSFRNTVNSEPFLGGPIGSVLCDGTPSFRYIYATPDLPAYWRVSFVFKHKAPWPDFANPSPPANSAWFARLRNQGYRQLVGGELLMIRDDDGIPIVRPRYLDAAGVVTSTPFYRFFQVYPTVNFGPLGIVAP